VRVLGFGTYDVERHPRVGIILEGLRAHGEDVFEADVPLGLDTAQRIAMVQRPWLAYRLVLRLARCWWRVARRARALSRAGNFDAIVVGYLGQFDVFLARLLFPRRTIVLDQLVFGADTADDRGLARAGGARQRLLRLLDLAAVRAADLVVLDTIEHRSLLPISQRPKAVIVPVGASSDWFRAGEQRAGEQPLSPGVHGPLRVVFFGLFTPLQGTDTIAAALAKLSERGDIVVTMIGGGQGLAAAKVLAAGNHQVSWLDWVPGAELPAVVAAHDVCLGIFGTGPKALRVVPNKVYQGAAAGCAVLSSDTAPQRRALGEAALLIPPGDPHLLTDALLELSADRERVNRLGAQARALAVASFQPSSIVEPLRVRLTE
jgi:glycosyltransferase involved in cell wall biosynthesis